MTWLRLWCASQLCKLPLHRFHFTCLSCRKRRRYLGKWTEPPQWIFYTYLWSLWRFHLVDKNGNVLAVKEGWETVRIDPRGHFTRLRCSIIVALDRIMKRVPKLRYPLCEVCEFFANYPTW